METSRLLSPDEILIPFFFYVHPRLELDHIKPAFCGEGTLVRCLHLDCTQLRSSRATEEPGPLIFGCERSSASATGSVWVPKTGRPLFKRLVVSRSQDWVPMDLETENRLAALLMKEARRLRQQADKEGVGIYLHDPKVRGRPNSRFLTATVIGVQQANRAVEVNEMWRAREKELQLDNKLSHRSKDTAKYGGESYHRDLSKESTSSKRGKPSADVPVSQSSRKHDHMDLHSEEEDGLKDEEVEEFLQSRTKRGRGAIGSRMDEPGPYPVCSSSDQDEQLLVTHESSAGDKGKRQVLGPKKPSWLLTDEQHKESPGRNSAREDHASRSKRQQLEDKHTHKKSKEKSRHHHKH